VAQRQLALIALFLFGLLAPVMAPSAEPQAAVYKSTASFDEVMEALHLAIEEKGLFINNVMHMRSMLERTGRDLGFDKPVYLRAESIEFCSALLSRRMLQEDPRRIVNCPFIISVYVLPDQPGTTYIAHRLLADPRGKGILSEITRTLKAIAESAAEGW